MVLTCGSAVVVEHEGLVAPADELLAHITADETVTPRDANLHRWISDPVPSAEVPWVLARRHFLAGETFRGQ
jgi:hypothetical protein